MRFLLVVLMLALSCSTHAKDISYANGHMFMLEYAPDATNVLYSYTPKPNHSWGGGLIDWDNQGHRERMVFARGNRLLWRQNAPGSQANLTAWMGLGQDSATHAHAFNTGAQIDYETRVFYSSLRSDWFLGEQNRGKTTAQLGWSPSAHDVDRWALWWVVRHEQTSHWGEDEKSAALVFRAFKDSTWWEIGVNEQGEPMGMWMTSW